MPNCKNSSGEQCRLSSDGASGATGVPISLWTFATYDSGGEHYLPLNTRAYYSTDPDRSCDCGSSTNYTIDWIENIELDGSIWYDGDKVVVSIYNGNEDCDSVTLHLNME